MNDKLQELLDQRDAADAVTALFLATDARDWQRVENCFTREAVLDMTSLAGGEPARLTGAQIAAGWREGLSAIDHVHHQVGNFVVRVAGDEAFVTCYGVAYHHREAAAPDKVRMFVGTYAVDLVRTPDGWRIIVFRFHVRFVSGGSW